MNKKKHGFDQFPGLIMLDTFLGQLRYISVDFCWARFIAVLLALCMFYCRLAHLVLPRPTTFLPPHYLSRLDQAAQLIVCPQPVPCQSEAHFCGGKTLNKVEFYSLVI